MLERKKYPFNFYIILALIPLVFIFLLETALRVGKYGTDTTQWIDAGNGKITLNNYIAKKYFHSTNNAPVVLSSNFDKVKKKNAFRVFILGESSAAGFPYLPNGSISNYIEDRLRLNYPDIPVEVINLGITAINSYAWLDLLPGIIGQKPDLLIIYGGHNEYYGAQGVASTESFGSSSFLIKLILWLDKFKTTELVRDIIKYISSFFYSDNGRKEASTLMAKLAKGQLVKYKSKLFDAGVEQFETNMRDIVRCAKENNIHVILSTMVSNLKDQKPFVSLNNGDQLSADTIFISAMNKLKEGDYKTADSLFRLAKDLDALKFRAPESFNHLIKQIAKEFNYPVADMEIVFKDQSIYKTIDNNLMTDHLHPNLKGYQLMGKEFYRLMKENKFLPDSQPLNLSDEQQDSIIRSSFNFSTFDSLIAEQRINILKNDWPYTKGNNLYVPKLINYEDTLAYKVATGTLGWGQAHRILAEYYFNKKNYESFVKEYGVLINTFPDNISYYDRIIPVLLGNRNYEDSYKFLKKRFSLLPDAFTSKWLGYIHLLKKENVKAIYYFEKSIELRSNDAETYFYITGAYGREKRFDEALSSIKKCLELNPDYPNGKAVLHLAQNEAKKRSKP